MMKKEEPGPGAGATQQQGARAAKDPTEEELRVLRAKWAVELPERDTGAEELKGGCRFVETAYVKSGQIGEGTYGTVFQAEDAETKEAVALKKIRMDNEKEGFPITAIREIKLLKTLEHENVIRLKEIVRSQTHQVNNNKGSIYMVFDYMHHDLTGLMERKQYHFNVPHLKCYLNQLLEGLAYCHQRGVLHRDLKAANVLINNSGVLCLADFGLARPFRQDGSELQLTNRVITLWYRPPELLLGAERYGPEIDIWSVGCIFAELLVGKPLFPGQDETQQLEKIAAVLGSPSEQNMPGCSKLKFHGMMKHRHKQHRLRQHLEAVAKERARLPEGALDLLERMLCLDPKKRISAAEAASDPFFSKPPTMAKRAELPRYEPSHELDMKRKRAQGHGQRHGQQGAQASSAKRPRYAGQSGAEQGQRAQAPQAPAPTAMPAQAMQGYGAQGMPYQGGGSYSQPQRAGSGAPGGQQPYPQGGMAMPAAYGGGMGHQGYGNPHAPAGYGPPGGAYGARPQMGPQGAWPGGGPPTSAPYRGPARPMMPMGPPLPVQNPPGAGFEQPPAPSWASQRR